MSATTTTTVIEKTLPKTLLESDGNNDSALNFEVGGDQPIRLHQIPSFSDKYAERKWAKEHMAAAFRIFDKLGFADGASGHISLRDPVDPSCFWIST